MLRAVVSCPDKAALGKLRVTVAISATLEEWQAFKKNVEVNDTWPNWEFLRVMSRAIEKYETTVVEDLETER